MTQTKYLETLTGIQILHNPFLNKDAAFTWEEREKFNLKGLLPPRVVPLETQVRQVMEQLSHKPTDLEKYILLMALESRNKTLFYRVVLDHIEELMPIIYTPTVGQACQQYGHIFRRPRGLFISLRDHGRVRQRLDNWPEKDVRIIVLTDGERILGLGDLGANGMGIPVGKLALYTVCAGIDPLTTLPVTLDVGTNNKTLQNDPLYIGLSQDRETGELYDELLDEFIQAVQDKFGPVLLQFEDFSGDNAQRLLEKYRSKICTFNDDIQGTASVTLAGLMAALRVTGEELTDQRLLFFGAGAAGIGIADLLVTALEMAGLSLDEARRRCWLFDSRGLVVAGRERLTAQKSRYAHPHAPVSDFLTAVQELKPTGIIGVSTRPGTFSKDVLAEMAALNKRPIIFALSNPTSKSECTAEEAYRWTDGRALFASGSPFDPITLKGEKFVPGQGNNAYIFPGLGLGVISSQAKLVTEEMFSAAAKALADQVTAADLAQGQLYPPLSSIREVSAAIATTVAEVAFSSGLAGRDRPADLENFIRSQMYQPVYRSYA